MFGNYEKPPAKKIKMKQQLLSFSYKPIGTVTAVLGRFTVLGPCVICTILLLHSVADLGEMWRMRRHPLGPRNGTVKSGTFQVIVNKYGTTALLYCFGHVVIPFPHTPKDKKFQQELNLGRPLAGLFERAVTVA
jgi:hypothetical protein